MITAAVALAVQSDDISSDKNEGRSNAHAEDRICGEGKCQG